MSINLGGRSGRPKSALVPEDITKVHKIVLYDRKLKLRKIADTLQISEGSVFRILHEFLGMHKLFSKWVPRLLASNQKQQRVEDSERCLELFKRGKKDFLRRYVTIDEIWIHHYTPETKRSSAEWTATGETKNLTVGWQGNGIRILGRAWHFVCKTINSDYYMALLDRLSTEIDKKRPHMQKKKVLFHQDNAPCHKSMKMMVKLNELSFELLPLQKKIFGPD